jgi:DNA-binding LytR/AlgR family response regulator
MLKILIVEDEELAANRLLGQLNKVCPDCSILSITKSVKETVRWLSDHQPDLIFMDIQLSDGLCFSVFDRIQVDCPIIFTTAYDQYAIEAFKVNSIDYLLKPTKTSDLEKSLQKFKSLKSAFMVDIDRLMDVFSHESPSYKERFLIRMGDVLKKVNATDCAYFFAKDKAVYLVTFDNKKYPIDDSLDSLEKQLNPDLFFRINRSLFVNIHSINEMTAWSRSRIKLELSPKAFSGADTLVSTSRSADFKSWLDS